jgi:sugar/nucleoside kinase (ribokinase family)
LPSLQAILPKIHILSPNAGEACSLLSLPYEQEPSKALIEIAAKTLYDFGVGTQKLWTVIVRSGELGVYIKDNEQAGVWIDAYWNDPEKVVDVTGWYIWLNKTMTDL